MVLWALTLCPFYLGTDTASQQEFTSCLKDTLRGLAKNADNLQVGIVRQTKNKDVRFVCINSYCLNCQYVCITLLALIIVVVVSYKKICFSLLLHNIYLSVWWLSWGCYHGHCYTELPNCFFSLWTLQTSFKLRNKFRFDSAHIDLFTQCLLLLFV